MIECKNMFYVSNFNSIGGVETFIHELARKYKDYDITVIYKTGDIKQLNRLKRYVRIIKYDKQEIKCKKAFFNYETDIIDNVQAEEYIQIIHAMFKTQSNLVPRVNPKITKYLCVSEAAGKEWEELTGIKPKLCRNPLEFTIEEQKPILLLISATRLTPEKGKDRMIKLSQLLDKEKVKYLWFIFTNDYNRINNPNIIYMKQTLDIRPYLAMVKGKGYGVQLSDCEGDCYFTRECEALGVPLLVTPIPSFKEQGLEEGKNCYYIPFEVNNIDIDKIVNNIPEYEGYVKDDIWNKVLAKGKTKYVSDYEKKVFVKVKEAVGYYYDLEFNRNVGIKDGIFEVTKHRANELINAGVCEIVEE